MERRRYSTVINLASNASNKPALYRKYFKKDSIKYVKQAERYWQSKTDSMADYIQKREKSLDNTPDWRKSSGCEMACATLVSMMV